MTVDMTPPPAVVKLVEDKQYKKITPSPLWNKKNPYNGYVVYFVKYENGNSSVILTNDIETRFATFEETTKIRKAIY